ncbi:DUF883 family protein [Legionella hackeliae]|uniref:DUF883 domain-containing protein n=1 Tax=Legionella hackeliae TaxID=449 RepID=A0A0A8UR26_LEGHA|nr:DUF883 family protein [Legionella hackeliae]KTD15307.1 hypothetical protein Lhac_0149 [Legionella hackeliae]CEK11325.1 conserved protein of unknown function [Legionella hackeliae]STX48096.1 Bacterial protein of uncharacterised function (DUF883) [Legionella hackeliae]
MTKNTEKSNGGKQSSKTSHEKLTADAKSTANKNRARDTQKDKIEEHYQQLKNEAHEWLNEGKKKIEETQDTLNEYQETLKEYKDELAENVKKNPLKAILIAGGIGFILSSLLRK